MEILLELLQKEEVLTGEYYKFVAKRVIGWANN